MTTADTAEPLLFTPSRLACLRRACAWLPILLGLCSPGAVWADEGMWTFNQFPSAKVQAAYGFAPGADWLQRLQRASVRIAGGCSASLVSPDGLVMTNHHCARLCIQNLSGLRGQDFNRDGFVARTRADEPRCPGMEMNQLVQIEDVTQAVQSATRDVAPERFDAVQKATMARIEKQCAQSEDWRCDVVTLFQGGQYQLYKYRRLQDIRLVFAPEDAIAFFGGDPDNFNFPRYDLDVTFLRIYAANGKAWQTPDYLPFAKTGVQDGELVFVSGNPGSTSRGLTLAQFADLRDHVLPQRLMRLSQDRGWISEYQQRGPEQLRHSNGDLFSVENTLKALTGRHDALADTAFWASLQRKEAALRAQVAAKPQWATAYGDVWDQVAALTERQQALRKHHDTLRDTYGSSLLSMARSIWRQAQEKTKPNDERLPEFSDARLPQLAQAVLSNAPIDLEFETAKLSYGLTRLRAELGADHALVKQLLGERSPQQVARQLVQGTRLHELQTDANGNPTGGLRKTLWEASAATLAASEDPLLRFVAAYDPQARAARKAFEEQVQGPLKKQQERLAQARFAVYGDSDYPDATFTLRLSYGRVQGWSEGGVSVPPFTDFAGAYRRHTGAEPFALPPTWLRQRQRVTMSTPFNLVSSNDIIGGNSGSPMVNRALEVVGLVFDGNIHSLGGDYGYEGARNRTVAVHSQALLEALDHIYPAAHIAAEIRSGWR